MSILTKYRPTLFRQVVGQDTAVRLLKGALKSGNRRCFLLSGPAGTGKTTLARIMTDKLKCEVRETDGAATSGVEAMRKLADSLHLIPMGKHKNTAVIIDECQRISAQAWDVTLKATEEPPPGVYWFFATTNPAKVPDTLQTRALHLKLQRVTPAALHTWLLDIAARERIAVPGNVIQEVAKAADGSPRQALGDLDIVRGARDLEDAQQLLQSARASDVGQRLCQTIATANGEGWPQAMRLVEKLREANEDPESTRRRVCGYLAAAAMGSQGGKAQMLLARMQAFAEPCDDDWRLVLAIGRALLAQPPD